MSSQPVEQPLNVSIWSNIKIGSESQQPPKPTTQVKKAKQQPQKSGHKTGSGKSKPSDQSTKLEVVAEKGNATETP